MNEYFWPSESEFDQIEHRSRRRQPALPRRAGNRFILHSLQENEGFDCSCWENLWLVSDLTTWSYRCSCWKVTTQQWAAVGVLTWRNHTDSKVQTVFTDWCSLRSTAFTWWVKLSSGEIFWSCSASLTVGSCKLGVPAFPGVLQESRKYSRYLRSHSSALMSFFGCLRFCFHWYCFTDPTHLFPAADHRVKKKVIFLFTKKVMFLFNCMSCIVPLVDPPLQSRSLSLSLQLFAHTYPLCMTSWYPRCRSCWGGSLRQRLVSLPEMHRQRPTVTTSLNLHTVNSVQCICI